MCSRGENKETGRSHAQSNINTVSLTLHVKIGDLCGETRGEEREQGCASAAEKSKSAASSIPTPPQNLWFVASILTHFIDHDALPT
jgi:hypothetical protein